MFSLASVFKLAVAVTAYRLADQHKLDLDERVSVTAADLRHGASPIAEAHPRGNVSLTMWELVRAMLVDSDNTACDIVLRAIGGPGVVQAMMTRLGYAGFAIRKTEADMYADARAGRTFEHGGENGGTPNAVADLLTAIASQRAAGLDATNELLLDLSDVRTGADRFRAGFPPNVRLAHKTGSGDTTGGLAEATNDAAIVTLPDGRRIVLVALLAAHPPTKLRGMPCSRRSRGPSTRRTRRDAACASATRLRDRCDRRGRDRRRCVSRARARPIRRSRRLRRRHGDVRRARLPGERRSRHVLRHVGRALARRQEAQVGTPRRRR